MKRIFLLFFITIIIIYSGCKKESHATLDNQIRNPFFDSAVQFLKTKLSNDDYAKLDLASNKILRYQNKNIGVQIFENEPSHNKFLLLGSDSGNYKGNWVDLSGLNTIRPKYQSGFITLESLDKGINTKLMVDSNEVIQVIKSGEHISNAITSVTINPVVGEVLAEVVVYYDVHAGDNSDYTDYSSLFWFFDGNYSYSDLYFQNGGVGGGGGVTGGGSGGISSTGQNNNVSVIPTFIPPETPILDLKEEVKCFTNNSSSTYSISVNVNEPYPNSRDVFNPLSTFPVGHAFFTLQQHNLDGSIITRNVGFYPKNGVKPGASVDKSTFGDDSQTPFDVSLQFNVAGADFNTVLNTLINQQAYNYDLNNFNCTTSPIDALKYININLPDTKSTDILFTGNDPADLGEDIRNLNLDNFSAGNGNRQFTRSVSNSNDQNPPPRQGN